MRRVSIGQGLSVFFRSNKTYFTLTIPPTAAILVSVIYLTISQIVRFIPKPYKDACVLASEPLTAFFLCSLSSARHRFCIAHPPSPSPSSHPSYARFLEEGSHCFTPRPPCASCIIDRRSHLHAPPTYLCAQTSAGDCPPADFGASVAREQVQPYHHR